MLAKPECLGRTALSITTIVMSRISRGSLWIDDDEFLSSSLLQMDVSFPQLLKEVHNTDHSLCVRTLPFRGGPNYSLDSSTINDEASRGLLSIVTNVASDE